MNKKLVIGTRGSKLALAQCRQVAKQVQDRYPQLEVELLVIKTEGDRLSEQNLSALSSQTPVRGVFTKEIEDALLNRKIDCAVHSFKDMAVEMPQELQVAAIPKRASAADVWVSLNNQFWLDAPQGFRVGSSSLRRQVQLRHAHGGLDVQHLRGNLDTRLRRLRGGEFDAIVVAMAGVDRLLSAADKQGLHFYSLLPQMVPAPAQGALMLQSRKGETEILEMLNFLDDKQTRVEVECERALLAKLGAGCSAPVGAWAQIKDGIVRLEALLGSWDQSKMVRGQKQAPLDQAQSMAESLAQELAEDLKK